MQSHKEILEITLDDTWKVEILWYEDRNIKQAFIDVCMLNDLADHSNSSIAFHLGIIADVKANRLNANYKRVYTEVGKISGRNHSLTAQYVIGADC